MQRKLIGYDVFEKLNENSLPATQYELIEAEDILSRVLETGPLAFHNVNNTHVVYETEDNTFVRANYRITKDAVFFENVEEVVIDEETEDKVRRDKIREMIDAVVCNDTVKANMKFEEVMELIRCHLQREAVKERAAKINEVSGAFSRRKPRRGGKAGSGVFVRHGPADPDRSRRAKAGHRKNPRAAFKAWETRKRHDPRGERQKRDRKLYGRFRKLAASVVGRKSKKHMNEWSELKDNVFGYIDTMENGRVLTEAAVKTNHQGEITDVKIPNSQIRTEGKLLSFQLKTLKTDLKILRETARRLSHDRSFVEMIKDLKTHNNLSDNNALEECIGEIVSKFPSVLYLTQNELAQIIGDSLSRAGVANYGDNTCQFMSEGILRVAHGAYNDRVVRIHHLAQSPITESDDAYVDFQGIVAKFYPTLDQNIAIEMKVFEDLYTATLEVRQLALQSQNEGLREEAEELADSLNSVLEGQDVASLELAATVAGWLENIVETNLESGEWEVTKHPHTTVTGDHPAMHQNAKHSYTPASDFSGDWGSELPQLDNDGKSYKTFGNTSKNKDYVALMDDGKGKFGKMYPDITNPYVPQAEKATMKGEAGVDKNWEDGLAQWQSGDTWGTGLNNPYVPKSVIPHVNNDNRVDDSPHRETDLVQGKGN